MTLGLSDRFRILEQSPHDLEPEAPQAQGTSTPQSAFQRWVPSRYNLRATTEDGRLVLWNSYTGAMSVFGAAQRSKIEALLSQKGFSARFEGVTKYLFERGFLVKEHTNEYRRIQVGFGQEQYRNDILQLILLASEDCNLRCAYCYEDFARGTMRPWVRSGIKRLIERRLSTLRQLTISWFGGEPLYGFQAIEDLAPFFVEVTREHSISFASHMTTNAYLLRPEVAEKLLSWKINDFQITIDGLQDDHDRNRPGRDGQPTFAVIVENLKSLAARKENFTVTIRFNYDRHNYAKCPDFLDMIEREFKGDPRFQLRFHPVGKWGGPNDDQLDVCGKEDSFDLERTMRREARKRGLKLSDEITGIKGIGTQVCYAARPYNFLIGASGKLMKCTIDLDKYDRNVVGEITEDGQLTIDQDKFALWTEPAFESDGKCRKCVILPTCQGMYCPKVRFDTGQSPCAPIRMQGKKDLLEFVQGADPGRRRAVSSSMELLPSANSTNPPSV
jgi:uncharacterized protein